MGVRRAGSLAYWVMSAKRSLPRKLSWWIWYQVRLPGGAYRGAAAPTSVWEGSARVPSLGHFHLTRDTTQNKKNKHTHTHSKPLTPPTGAACPPHGNLPPQNGTGFCRDHSSLGGTPGWLAGLSAWRPHQNRHR